MADTATFNITYDGPGLVSSEIPVRELAPALIEVANLLEEANLVINGNATKIEVNVRGSFKSGSFGIDFTMIQTAIQGLIGFFSSDGVTASVNLLELIGFLKGNDISLIEALRLVGGRPIEKVEEVDDQRIRLTIKQSNTVEMDKRLLPLMRDARVRSALAGAIAKPLENDGIDRVITASGTEEFPKRGRRD